jgi:hypothetical protein
MITKPSGMKISEGGDIFDHKEMWVDNFELIDAYSFITYHPLVMMGMTEQPVRLRFVPCKKRLIR